MTSCQKVSGRKEGKPIATETIKYAGLSLKVDGGAEFKKTLQQINDEVKISKAEFQKVVAEYGKGSTAVEVLTAKQKLFQGQLSSNRDEQRNLSEMISRATDQYGASSHEVATLKAKLLEAEGAEIRLGKSIADVSKEIENKPNLDAMEQLKRQSEEASQKLKTLENSIKSTDDEVRISQAEFQKVVAQYGSVGNSVEVLTAKQKTLQTSLQANKTEQQNLNAMLAIATKEYGENSSEVAQLKVRLIESETAGIKLEKAIQDVSKEISEIPASTRLVELRENAQAASDKYKALGEKLKESGGQITSAGQSLTMGITMPILAAGVASFKMASDVGESINKVDVAFGDAADRVHAWSKTTLESYGIARGTSADMAALFGDMATSMKVPQAEAANLSTGLVGLAGDLSSFKNISLDQSAQSLKGIFTGETESLKGLGIVMTQANLDAYAMANGFGKVAKDMTDAEKINLRYQYILEATKNAQGDFARTSDGAANQMRIFQESTKELAASFGEILLPMITPVITEINKGIKAFGELDESQKKNIIAVAGLAAAIGPVVIGVGSFITAIGSISSAIGVASGALAAGGGAVGVLGTTITALMGPVGLAVVGVTALVAGGNALYKHMSEELIPTVDHFGEGISTATKKATEGFLELNQGVTEQLTTLNITGQAITDEMATTIVGNLSSMADQTKTAIENTKVEAVNQLSALFAESTAMSEEEEQAIVQSTVDGYAAKTAKIVEAENQIKTIMESASSEKRKLTEEEKAIIIGAQELIATEGIKNLTDNQREQKVILEKMKENADEITARQAAAVVQNAVAQREKVVAEAQTQYDKTVAEIIKQRDEMGTISEDQASIMIKEAQRQRDETIAKAEETHTKIVSSAKEQAGEHVNQVNWETGQILTKWDQFKSDVAQKWNEIKTNAGKTWESLKSDTIRLWEEIKKSVSDKVNELKDAVTTKISDAKKAVTDTWNDIINFLKNIDLKEIGSNIMQGMINGITGKIDDLKKATISAVQGVPDTIMKFFDMASPSKLTTKLFEFVGQGGVNGLKNSIKPIAKASEDIAKTVESKLTIDTRTMGKNLSSKMEKEVGALVAEKFAKGIDDNKKKVVISAEKMAAETFTATKLWIESYRNSVDYSVNGEIALLETLGEKYKSLSQEKVWVEDNLQKLRDQQLKEQQAKEKESFDFSKSWIESKKQLGILNLQEEVEAWERVQERYEVGTEQRKQADASLFAAQTKMFEEQDKIVQRMADAEEKYQVAVDNRAKAIGDTFGIFDEMKKVEAVSTKTMVDNLKVQVDAMSGWEKDLVDLSKSAIDKGLLQQLREMGPSAYVEIDALNKMTEKELTTFSELFKTKQAIANRAAIAELATLRTDTNTEIAKIADDLEKIGGQKMKESGLAVADGFIQAIKSKYEDMRQVAYDMAKILEDTTKKTLQINSPSKTIATLYGFAGEGAIFGLKSKTAELVATAKNISSNVAESLAINTSNLVSAAKIAAQGVNIGVPVIQQNVEKITQERYTSPASPQTTNHNYYDYRTNNVKIDPSNMEEMQTLFDLFDDYIQNKYAWGN